MNFWLVGNIVEDKTYFSNRYIEAASYWLYAAVGKVWKYGLKCYEQFLFLLPSN